MLNIKIFFEKSKKGIILDKTHKRRDGWVVEGDGLENRYILWGIEGSNPSLSAIFFAKMRDSLNEMKAIP